MKKQGWACLKSSLHLANKLIFNTTVNQPYVSSAKWSEFQRIQVILAVPHMHHQWAPALLHQIMVHTLPNLCDKLGSELDNCANTFQIHVFSSNCLGLSVVGRSSASGVSGQLHTVASCQAPGDPSHCTTASDNSWPKAYQHVPSYQSHPSFGNARIKSSLIISKHCHDIPLEQLQYPTFGEWPRWFYFWSERLWSFLWSVGLFQSPDLTKSNSCEWNENQTIKP